MRSDTAATRRRGGAGGTLANLRGLAAGRSLDGAVVVLVGASSGVGRASALAFADHGAKLVLVARDRAGLDEVAAACARGGEAPRPLVVSADVSEPDAMDRVADQAVECFGRIDVWVHAASVLVTGDLADHPLDEIRQLIEINVVGCANGARAALRCFRAQGDGVLVIVSSLLGVLPNPLAPMYVASKFATRGLALSLRHAVAAEPDIHVTALLPGPIDTPIFDRAANHTGAELRAIPPATAPERVAAAVVARARRPRRQSTTGAASRALLFGHRLAPRLAEWVTARWSAATLTDTPPAPERSGTLFDTADERSAGRGPGDVSADTSDGVPEGEVRGGYRRGSLRRRLGSALGNRLARVGADPSTGGQRR